MNQLQEALKKLEQTNESLLLYKRIFMKTVEGIVITDSHGTIIRVNEAFEKLTGYAEEELIGSNPRMLQSGKHDSRFYLKMWRKIAESGHWEGEIWDRKKSGELYPVYMTISELKNSRGETEHYAAIFADISNLKEAERKLNVLAHYDDLTGIPNRRLFYKRIGNILSRTSRNTVRTALLLMDLDGFKLVNDSLGHSAGDLLLKKVAARLRACVHNIGMASRIGGDEFTIILENIPNLDYVKDTAQNIIRSIRMPYYIEEKEITLGASIGIAIGPEDGMDTEDLMRKADAAMYAAKKTGNANYFFISEKIDKQNRELLELQTRLKEAIEHKEFSLFLQPQVSCTEGRFQLSGAEALIRWHLPEGGMCPPDKFIPIAEKNGMITAIDQWVFEEILRINEKLRDNGIVLKLAVNVSARQLETDEFIDKLSRNPAILENQIILELEITERFLLTDFDRALFALKRIRNLGIYAALDDFGTGFSSLSYLARLPINYLKIDKSFIDNIEGETSLVPDIIAMAKKLGIKTIAEGVETKSRAVRLFEEKCDEIQGYYFGGPMDIEAFIEFAKGFEREEIEYGI